MARRKPARFLWEESEREGTGEGIRIKVRGMKMIMSLLVTGRAVAQNQTDTLGVVSVDPGNAAIAAVIAAVIGAVIYVVRHGGVR